MAIHVTIVGWHIHPEAAVCNDCDNPATVVADPDDGSYTTINLCKSCLDGEKYFTTSDKIEEVFKDLGL